MKTTITTDDNIVAAHCSFYLAEDTPEGYQELFDDANEPFRSTKKQEVLDRVEEAKECQVAGRRRIVAAGHLFLVEERTTITRL